MFEAFSRIWRDPFLRVPTITLFVGGFSYAATVPYQSIIGINELGMSDGAYSVLIFAAAAINVVASVLLGILSDKLGDRRNLVMALAVAGMFGFGLVYFMPTVWIFVGCILILIPISNATYSILFGSIRATTNMVAPREATSIASAVRAVYSGSWALMPGLVGLYLARAESMIPAYAVAAGACVAAFCLYLFFMPRTPKELAAAQSSGPSFLSSLGRIFEPMLLLRLTIMALITGTQRLSTTLAPLIITQVAHGSVADVGFTSGAIALLEIPFIMFWGAMLKRFHNVHVLAVGTVVYCVHLVLLSFVTAPWQFYALIGINSCGAAAILCVPISYLQDLIGDRPGLGSSLIAVNLFLSGGVAAIFFAIGTTISSYSDTALVAASGGAIAIVLMLALENRSPRQVAA